jgi:excisionase family DNA binding protein
MDSNIVLRQEINNKQSALLLGFTGFERVRIWHEWHHVSELADGQLVDEISYLGQHALRVGDTLQIGKSRNLIEVEVLQIRLAEVQNLSHEEVGSLGYRSLDEYTQAKNRPLPERAWYIEFERVDESQNAAPPEARILDDVLTAQEAATLFNLSESTIRVNIHRGNIPARKSGGTWLIRRSDAERKWSK